MSCFKNVEVLRNFHPIYEEPEPISHEDVLKNVSLHVKEGEIVSIVGANGAGKSTLLNTISGLVKPRSGNIEFCGKPLQKVICVDFFHGIWYNEI